MYKISITQIASVTLDERDWKQVRQPYPFEANLNSWLTAQEKEKRDADPQYAYIPVRRERDVETKVLEQTVESLDLTAVIKAVNGIS